MRNLYYTNTAMCPIKVNSNTIKPTLHTSCPPASRSNREVANLTEIKNPRPRIWCHIIFGSVCNIFTSSPTNSKKPSSKKFACLGARAVLIGSTLPVLPKDSHFWTNSYLDSHHYQGGMKFATQISPILNYSI